MPWFAVAAAILVQFCWGGNYSASKLAMQEFSPLLVISIRFFFLSLLLLPFMRRYGWPTKRALRDFAVIGFTTILFHFTLLLLALNHGLNVTSCILAVQLGVPFSCLFASFMFNDRLGPWRSAGLALAFIGVMLVAATPNATSHWVGFAIAIVAALGWTGGNLYLKVMKPQPVLPLLFWPGLLMLPFTILLSLAFESGQVHAVAQASWLGWTSMAYSVLFSSLVGYGLWNWLMTSYPVNHVVPFTLLLPVAGIAGGVLLFHDPLNWHILVGAAFTISGVGIIAARRPKLMQAENI